METLLWVVGIHLLELVGLGCYILIRNSNRLENVVMQQQQYIDSINIITGELNMALGEINDRFWVEGDEEMQTTFQKIKELQSILSEITVK